MSADLQRIGWLRSAVLVCACAFLAFAAWSASGANVGSSHEGDVKVRPVQARPAPAATTPAPRARVKHQAGAPAAQTPAPARTHLCARADGHHYRVDAQIKCLKLTNPSAKLLDRARRHKPIITPAKPSAPATPSPGAATPRPAGGTDAATTPTPSSKATPTGGTAAP